MNRARIDVGGGEYPEPDGVDVVNQIVPRFLAQHPKIEVEIQVENRRADIVRGQKSL